MAISDITESYLTVIKTVLITFIFGLTANLIRYIYSF